MWIRAAKGYLSGSVGGDKRREGIRILAYHGVTEQPKDSRLERNLHLLSDFRAHVSFLLRFRVLSFVQLKEEITKPANSRKPAVVITFDDGYVNNLLAAEILSAFRLPWLSFIATGAVGRENSIWTVELSLLLLHGAAAKLELFDKLWPLGTREEREVAFQAIRPSLKTLPSIQRKQMMQCIREQFPKEETKCLLSKFPSLQMLSWEEVSQLASAGAEVGSHGVEHEIHHANQPEVVRRRELIDSKAELEKRLGKPCDAFAFPNGDFNEASAVEVSKAGYQLAFTTYPRTVTENSNPFLLPRLYPPNLLVNFARQYFWEPRL